VALWSSGGPDPRDSQLTPQPYLPVTQCLPHRSKQLFLPPGSPNLTLIQMVSKMGKENKLRKISIGMLPSGSSVVFKESTYFLRNGSESSLPLPAEIRANQRPGHYGPVQLESLSLLVKYGKDITIAEGQCLWALRRFLPSQVPVPDVYGWCEDNGEVFIYMELVRGVTLEKRWESLSKQERKIVCDQLRAMLLALRNLQQDPKDQFLGEWLSRYDLKRKSKLITFKVISTANLY
jgi:hypothetical protein